MNAYISQRNTSALTDMKTDISFKLKW